MSYDHKVIDGKWQKRWVDSGVFHAETGSKKEKYYILVEFPYPSGAGLHVGHPRSYTALDIVARKKRMEGKNVLFPMGWDAFGLPTENYAIKTGRSPQDVTQENVATFKRQLQAIGYSFDWTREVNTTDPAYYKWTQWMFLEFFKAGLAYKATMAINWCPSCKIGLANEEVVGGNCERCGAAVEKRDKEQWMIAITKYADRLLSDLDTVNYLPKIRKQQEEWIGRSEGAEVDFEISHPERSEGTPVEKITVFTTRIDTIFGATYVVLAPEHPLVSSIVTDEQRAAVDAYVAEAKKKTEIDRGDDTKEKTGVFTGAYAINPANNEKVPVWVADYVLGHYGTGAVMAVPSEDSRDRLFALNYGLEFKQIIWHGGPVSREALSSGSPELLQKEEFEDVKKNGVRFDGGHLMNSGQFDNLRNEEAAEQILDWLESQKKGYRKITYKLRDWVFSRQRYWGEPIPLVHCEKDGWVAVPVEQLPVVLPPVEKYEPTDNGDSPLATIDSFVNTTCPTCGGPAKRETDTMPNWAGSSWYFLRYIDSKNDQEFASKEALQYWTPVDLYNGGMEHTTLHLLYSRFWHKFLFDRGLVPTAEPYARRHSHGLIMAEDGTKMSKSKGNVVNPDEIVNEYGADTLRVYEVFMGPFEEPVPWSMNGVIGVRRFLDKVMRMGERVGSGQSGVEGEDVAVTKMLHKTIAKVTKDIEGFGFNTAVAQMMTFVNVVQEKGAITKESFALFLRILVPFAPHVANELWEKLGFEGFAEQQAWPVADAAMLVDDEMQIAVQVNGKLRATITVASGATEEEIVAMARAEENVRKFVTSEPKKVIFVKGRLVSFVVE